MSDQNIRVEITGTAEDLRRATNSAVRDIRNVAQETRRADAQMVVSNEAAARSLRQLEDRQAGVAQQSRNFGQILRTVGWSALATEIGPVTSAVADAGVALAGAAEAAAPLAGVVATLPNLLGSAGQAGIVATLAFRGMDKALAGDQKALAKLTPEAQKFVRTIRSDVGPVIRDLQKQAQAGLLPGVTKGVESLVKDAPVIKKAVRATADELGRLAEKAGAAASTPGFQKDLGQFAQTNVTVIHDLGDAALHLGEGFREVVDAAQPLTRDLAHLANTISVDLEGAIVRARRSGDLASFFNLTDTRVHQSVQVLKDTGTVLLNIGRAANPLGNQLAGGLVAGMDKLAHLTAGPGLEHFFQGAQEPLHQVGLLARDLAIDLGHLAANGQDPLSHIASTLRTQVLPVFSDLAQLLATDVSPDVTMLVGDLGKIAKDALPGLHAAMPIVHTFADGLHAAAVALDDIEQKLPGVTKLLVPLGIFAGAKAAKGLPGKLGGEASSLVKSLRGSTPANPLFVADVTGGGKGVPGGLPGKVAKDAEHAPKGTVNTVLEKVARFAPLSTATAVVGGGLAATYGGGVLFDKLFGGAKGSDQRTQDFIKGVIKDSPTAAAALDKINQKLKDLHAEEDKVTRMGGDDRTTRDYDRQYASLNKLADALRATQGATEQDFKKMKAAAGENLSAIRATVQQTTRDIVSHLGTDTAAGKDALAHNFQLAAGAVKASMDAGLISTKTGLAEIQKLMRAALAQYGITGKQASNYLAGKDTVSGKPLNLPAGSPSPGHAGGAMIVGRPGEKGRDTVPALLNGHPAVVARGEMVAVLNRHQQTAMDKAARAGGYGGLAGLMAGNSKPHYMASGGMVDAKGGLAAMVAAASSIDSHHYPYQWGGGHGGWAGPYDCSGAVSAVLHAGGDLSHPLVSGDFMNYGLPGAGEVTIFANPQHVYMRIGNRYFGTSLSNPGGGAGWFQGGARPGFVVRHVPGAGGDAQLKPVSFPKGLGALSAVGQAGLDRVSGAANQQLSAAIASLVDVPSTGSGQAAEIPGGVHDVVASEASRRGWSAADWLWIIGQESGGQAVFNKRGSGAFGVGQLMPSNYGRLGGAPGSSLTEQTLAMGRYIAERYGDPTKAKAYWENHHSYSVGGLIRAAGGAVARAASTGIGNAILGTGDPVSNTGASKSKKKKAKKVTKVVGLPGIPRPSKAKHTKGTATKTKHVSDAFTRLMAFPDFQAPSFESFDTRRDGIEAQITEITGRMGLRNDQETITLPVAAALAAGLVSQADIDKAGLAPDDQVEVVNRDGGVDASDRKFHGGIVAHTSDLSRVIGLRQSIIDMLGGGQSAGIDTELGRARFARGGYAGWAGSLTKQLEQMRTYYEANVTLRSDLIDQRQTLEHRRPRNWQELVQADHTTIKSYQKYLSGLGGLPAGFKYDKKAVHDRRVEVQAKIKHLESEVRQLESTKPNVGKKNIDRYNRLYRHIKSIDVENTGLQGHVSGAWDPTAGRAGELSTTITGLRGNVDTIDGVIRELVVHQIPDVTLQRDSDNSERADWLGTTAPDLPKGTASNQDSEKNALLQQLLDTANRQHAVDTSQFSTLQAFQPLVNLRYLGAFARGVTNVGSDGLAILHQGETVTPNPTGPWGSQIARGGDGVTVELHFADNSAQLISLVDARVDGRAAKVSSQQLGGRQRLIAVAPGGRR